MPDLSLGWRTDLAVLRSSGARITQKKGYLLVESPDNPAYHWGNFILVTSGAVAASPAECLRLFTMHFPGAEHVAIGLPTRPAPGDWERYGVVVESYDVLVSTSVPAPTVLPDDYRVRELAGERDWSLHQENQLADRPAGVVLGEYADFVTNTVAARRRLVRDGHGAFFGAFQEDTLAADLGIVLCPGGSARFQNVWTLRGHRRRGLASHLLAVAGGWAARRGAHQWVILAESGSDAARLYRARGFAHEVGTNYQVYRGQAWAPDPTQA
jgi:GNAT superfamily N-acetyltransferase